MTLCLDNLVNPSEALEEIANNWEQVITNMDVFHPVAIPSQLFKELFQLKSFRSSCVSFTCKSVCCISADSKGAVGKYQFLLSSSVQL